MPRLPFPLPLSAAVPLVCCAPAAPAVLTLTTTTSTENSGLLAWLHPGFEAATGIRVKVVANGTGAALQVAREGNADVVLAHAPALEEAFVAEGWGLERVPVMYNDFVLVGPPDDPAGLAPCDDAPAGLARLAEVGALFVSRGDASGTHEKEQELWRATGLPLLAQAPGAGGGATGFVRPEGDWYHAVGQGMGPTLAYATERRGTTLSDRGTWVAMAFDEPSRTDLAVLCEGDPRLFNPYAAIQVDPARHPHVQAEAARRYVDWLLEPATQARIGAFQVKGHTLFFPGPPPEMAR